MPGSPVSVRDLPAPSSSGKPAVPEAVPDVTPCSTSSSARGDESALSSRRISLWLLPPEPVAAELSSIQDGIVADGARRGRRLPRFVPHVTLIGGIPISDCCTAEEAEQEMGEGRSEEDDGGASRADLDETAARIVVWRLRRAFRWRRGVRCAFDQGRGVFAAGGGGAPWNQCCVAAADLGPSFFNAMAAADAALFPAGAGGAPERHLRGPLREPHLSYAYGLDDDEAGRIPPSLKCPPSFTSTEMAVYWTDPPSLEGVETWREIGRVRMGG